MKMTILLTGESLKTECLGILVAALFYSSKTQEITSRNENKQFKV